MKWFIIDYEIAIFGKDTETVQATDKETAKSIALFEIAKRNGVKEHEIEISSCKIIQS